MSLTHQQKIDTLELRIREVEDSENMDLKLRDELYDELDELYSLKHNGLYMVE